jgi:tRNA threonylcarbamoyladenosine biosynthesis protein TsaE
MQEPFHHLVPRNAPRSRVSVTQNELTAWGEHFGQAVTPPLVVAVAGDLGAGKTTLVQAICRGYGVVDEVTSPTFALVHRYDGRLSPVYHLDLYRLERADELTNIGWDDIVNEHALILIEWPERAGARVPAAHVALDLEHHPTDAERRILLAG